MIFDSDRPEIFDREARNRLSEIMILIRWIIILFLALNFFISKEIIHSRTFPATMSILAVYAAFNLLLVLGKKRAYSTPVLHFLVDAIAISLLIYYRGGIRSDLFLLYYFFLLFITTIHGFRSGILAMPLILLLYSLVCFSGTEGISVDVIIYEIVKRLFYFSPAVLFIGVILRRNELLFRENVEKEALLERIRKLNAELTRGESERESELTLARQVMESVVCQEKEYKSSNITVNVKIRYAGKLGGDYYGILPDCPSKGLLTIFIGDVAGRGTSAALLMVSMIVLLREASQHYFSAREALTYVNKVLVNNLDAEFFNTTVFMMILDVENCLLTYSGAGHEGGVHYEKKSGRCRELPSRGALLGVIPDAPYMEDSLELGSGDKVLLYTDGLVEARNRKGALWGRKRLEEVVTEKGECPGGDLIDRIFEKIDKFSPSKKIEDDQALIVVTIG